MDIDQPPDTVTTNTPSDPGVDDAHGTTQVGPFADSPQSNHSVLPDEPSFNPADPSAIQTGDLSSVQINANTLVNSSFVTQGSSSISQEGPAKRRREASDVGDDDIPKKTFVLYGSKGSAQDVIEDLQANLDAKDAQLKFFADRSMAHQAELYRVQQELQQCQERTQDLIDERDRATDSMNAALSSQQPLKDRQQHLQDIIADLKEELSRKMKEDELTTLQQRITALETANEEQSKTIASLRGDNIAIILDKDAKVRAAVGQIEVLKRRQAEENEDNQVEMAARDTRIADLQEHVASLQVALESERKSLSAELELLRGTHSELAANFQSFRSHHHSCDSHIHSLQEDLAKLEKQLEAVGGLEERLGTLHAELKEQRQKADEAFSDLGSAHGEITKLRERVTSLNNENLAGRDESSAKLRDLEKKLEDANAQLSSSNISLLQVQKQLTDLQRTEKDGNLISAALRQELAEKINQLVTLGGKHDDLERKLQDSEVGMEQLRNDLAEEKRLSREKNEEHHRVGTQLEESQTETERLKQSFAEEKRLWGEQKEEYNQLKTQLDHSTQAMDTLIEEKRLLNQQVQDLTIEVQNFKRTNAASDRPNVAQLTTLLGQSKTIIDDLREQLSACDPQAVKKLQQSLESQKDQIETLEANLESALSSEDNLRNSVRFKTTELERAKADNKSLIIRLADAERSKSSLEERLNWHQQQLSDVEKARAAQTNSDVPMGCSEHEETIARLQSELDAALRRDWDFDEQDDGPSGGAQEEGSTPKDKGKGRARDDGPVQPVRPHTQQFSFAAGIPRPNDPTPFGFSTPPGPSRNPNQSQAPAVPFIPSTQNIETLVDNRLMAVEERLGHRIDSAIRQGLGTSSPTNRTVKRTPRRQQNGSDSDADTEEDGHAKLNAAQKKAVRNASYKFFGIKKHAKEAHTLPFVPQAELDAYRLQPEDRTGDPPPLSIPYRPDWGEKWGNYNQSLGDVFMAKWKDQEAAAGAVDAVEPTIPPALVLGHFKQIIETLIKNRRNKLTGTPSEVFQRETRTKKNNRCYTRRDTLYNSRYWMANYHYTNAKTEAEKTLYEYMWNTIKTVGLDGTSSDESDPEDPTGNTYKVHALPWKSSLVTDIEEFLDDQLYARVGQENTQGRKLRNRKDRNGVSEIPTKRPAPNSLPSNFYSAAFLQLRRPLEVNALNVQNPVRPVFWVYDKENKKATLLE